MYKSKLQELCQQKLWTLPHYISSREGPDHCPFFKASVVVNGVSFDGPVPCKSSKEAQSEAARIAYDHLAAPAVVSPSPTPVAPSSSPSSPSPPATSSSLVSSLQVIDMQYMYKSQLQNFARKSGLNLPVYSCVREGPSHAVRFKAIVTVDGNNFESPDFFRTLKEAEHAAAKSALSTLSKDGNQEEDCSLYKNLLQELTQKEGFSIPVYRTTKYGESHAPTFSSTVEIEGDIFHGMEAKSKKQAELIAAKVAFLALKPRRPAHLSQSGIPAQAQDAPKSINSSLVNVDPQPSLKCIDNSVSALRINSEERKDGDKAGTVTGAAKASGDSVQSPPSSTEMKHAGLGDPYSSQPSSPEDDEESAGSDSNSEVVPVATSISCSRVRVYPYKPNMSFPEGVSVLPISDDKWVAVSLEFNNQNGN